jgi:hypothetical protein
VVDAELRRDAILRHAAILLWSLLGPLEVAGFFLPRVVFGNEKTCDGSLVVALASAALVAVRNLIHGTQ